jgi:hydroxypyruvate isomerase
MDLRRNLEFLHRLAQEIGLFANALNEMNLGAGLVGQRAGDRDAGEAGTGAEIDPGLGVRRQVEELERIGDVPGPNDRNCRAGDQIEFRLGVEKEIDIRLKPLFCFT